MVEKSLASSLHGCSFSAAMKTLRHLILTIALALTSVSLHGADGLAAPALDVALKYNPKHIVLFQPTLMPATATLNFSHIRMGDGSVKPGEVRGAQLVIYASTPNENGVHQVLYVAFNEFGKDGSPITNFQGFNPARDASNFVTNGRCGIIAILIGLNQPRGAADFKPASLPAEDIITAEITPGDSSLIGLLLPAVQKVRAAAARN